MTAVSPQKFDYVFYDMYFVSVDMVKMQEKEREKMYVAITFELGVVGLVYL